MAGTLEYVVEQVRRHIAARRTANEGQVWKGQPHDQYMKLCGAQSELDQMAVALNDAVRKANSSTDMDDDEEVGLTARLKQL